MEKLIEKLEEKQSLETEEIKQAADYLLDPSALDETKANFLRKLAQKGESPEEIAGFVKAFLSHAIAPGLDVAGIGKPVIDVCGTGGDRLHLFNISTTTIFILAAADIVVVKHGNRGITSQTGGADVLETLGVPIDLLPEEFCRCVQEIGAGFLFAQQYHPAFKAIAPVRQQLKEEGLRTVFNMIGPLLNPVKPTHQLIGVFEARLPPVYAEILAQLGRKTAWAIHGISKEGKGMDEFSVSGPTIVAKVEEGKYVGEETIDPQELGIDPFPLSELKGGKSQENAKIIEGILDGSIQGAKRAIVTLNAAASLVIAGKASAMSKGLLLADEILTSGAALEKLKQMQAFARS